LSRIRSAALRIDGKSAAQAATRIGLTAAAAGVPQPQLVHIASELLIAHQPDWEGSLLGDKSHTALFDNSKLKQAVPDFAAQIPFTDGIKRTMAWFDADPARSAPSAESNRQIDQILQAYAKAWPHEVLK
jgi:hypothetical protein